ncbi:NrdH-redoxin [Weissella diestrammenae]|uniref:NrdH-redoxin n=1 Tax=Weissella diestrammenae TaxID=1162633 RepID=A0A7G9T7D1_9LACO|nr:hypothetical protein [Weissella diestrammenae]QNN76006.1 NrdH-redoxin [Weissella diestrammenae]
MNKKSATIYHVTGCLKCKLTAKLLEQRGITVHLVNVDQQPKEIDRLKQNGIRRLPVIKMSDGQVWTGLNFHQIWQQ